MTEKVPDKEKADDKLSRQEFLSCCGKGALSLVLGAAMCCGGQAASVESKAKAAEAKPDPPAAVDPKPGSLHLPFTLTPAGQLDHKMEKLTGVAFDRDDHLYAACAPGVIVFDPSGKPLRIIKTSGPACCVTIDGEGNAYVGQRTLMEKFDPQGKLLASWGQPDEKQKKNREPKDGEFIYITSVATTGRSLYIADSGARRIHHFSTDGDFIEDFTELLIPSGNPSCAATDLPPAGTKLGNPAEKFVIPSGYFDCATDAQGILHVGHTGKHRVERYDGSDQVLSYWGKFGNQPEDFCGCCNPTNLALFADGRVATTEKGMPRLKVYDANGKLLAYLGSEAFPLHAAGLDLAIDSKDRIALVEPQSGTIRFYVLTPAGK